MASSQTALIDGGIAHDGRTGCAASAEPDAALVSDDIAEADHQLDARNRSAWTQEIDRRSWKVRS